jgi:hypothetical protein
VKDLFFGSKANIIQGKACLVARVESEMARLPGVQVAEQPKAAAPEPDTATDGFFNKMKRMKMERKLQVEDLHTLRGYHDCCSGAAGQ